VPQGPDPLLPWVGLWPLQAAYGGEDLSGNDHHLNLTNVTFPADGATPWASPAAAFLGTGSHGVTELGLSVNLDSYSWMAQVYIDERASPFNYVYLTDTVSGLYIRIYETRLTVNDPHQDFNREHPASLSLRTWHTLAVTFHFPNNTLTAWVNGTNAVFTGAPCESRPTPRHLYIGNLYVYANYMILWMNEIILFYSAVTRLHEQWNIVYTRCKTKPIT
jgi:hypothetical protein